MNPSPPVTKTRRPLHSLTGAPPSAAAGEPTHVSHWFVRFAHSPVRRLRRLPASRLTFHIGSFAPLTHRCAAFGGCRRADSRFTLVRSLRSLTLDLQ